MKSMAPTRETVIIPDVHQNHRFVDKVLERHDLGSLHRLIFLGDFFDSKEPFFAHREALEATLQRILKLVCELGDRMLILLGNHDVLYYFNREEGALDAVARNALHSYYGLPNRESLAVAASMELAPMWERVQLAHLEQGYLLTHAGVTSEFWSKRRSFEQNVAHLNHSMTGLLDAQGQLAPVFRAGFSRGGDALRGGPLWLDWNQEFTEEIGIPQIVGHTVGSGFRQQGRSYCLDARQQGYGVLQAGQLSWVAV